LAKIFLTQLAIKSLFMFPPHPTSPVPGRMWPVTLNVVVRRTPSQMHCNIWQQWLWLWQI